MRFRVFILLGLVTTALAQAAGINSTSYEELRQEARLTKLIGEIDDDVKAARYEAALKKVDEASKIQPNEPKVLNARGAVLTELRRFDEAGKALDAALAADPKGLAPQFNQRELLFLQKKYVDAAEGFAELQGSFGELSLLKYKVYLCWALAGKKDKADAALALMRFPQDGVAWYFAYAVDRQLAGKKSEAKRLISVAKAIDAESSRTYVDSLRDSEIFK